MMTAFLEDGLQPLNAGGMPKFRARPRIWLRMQRVSQKHKWLSRAWDLCNRGSPDLLFASLRKAKPGAEHTVAWPEYDKHYRTARRYCPIRTVITVTNTLARHAHVRAERAGRMLGLDQ
jgi:hypothetical protein